MIKSVFWDYFAMFNDRNYHQHQLRAFFWFVAVALGALHAWATRHVMHPDGISYLDMGDAYLRDDWGMAINACWSPFYSWILGLAMFVLKPPPYWEFSVVHLVNFIIYVGALGCFDFFLCKLLRYRRKQTTSSSGDGRVILPEWVWLALGYTMFIWSSIDLITIWAPTPDMCVAAFVYLASGIILRIRMGYASWLTFALLGVVLGFGYLAKAPIFPLAFIFLGVSMFSVGNLRRAVPRVLIALLTFLSVASPFIAALSMTKGRLTFGDTAKLNYAWFVNGITSYAHWQGEPSGSGIPRHPTRKIFDVPAIYEFGTPIGGTYPPWYDPSYWNEGIVPHFNLSEQIRALMLNAKNYYHIFFYLQMDVVSTGKIVPPPRNTYHHILACLQGGLIVGFFILFYMGLRGWLGIKDIAKHWCLLILAIAAFGMYSLVHVEARYIGAFVLLLWAGVFSGVRFDDSQESRKRVVYVTIAILTIMWTTIGGTTIQETRSTVCDLIKGMDASTPHVQWQVADGLKRIGVQPGDKVASIGNSMGAYWARLARVRIVAETPFKDVDSFWAADHLVKSRVMETFARAGAKAIVAEKLPDYVSKTGWQRIGKTDYYAYILPGEENAPNQ